MRPEPHTRDRTPRLDGRKWARLRRLAPGAGRLAVLGVRGRAALAGSPTARGRAWNLVVSLRKQRESPSDGDITHQHHPRAINQALVVAATIPALTLATTVQVVLSGYFSDPDGDVLTYSATSSDTR